MVLNVECSLLNIALKMENRRVFQPTLRGRLESNVHIVSPKSQCHFLYSTHGYQKCRICQFRSRLCLICIQVQLCLLTWWGHGEGFTKDSPRASPQLPQAHSKHAFTQHLGWGTTGEQGGSGPRWLVECVWVAGMLLLKY